MKNDRNYSKLESLYIYINKNTTITSHSLQGQHGKKNKFCDICKVKNVAVSSNSYQYWNTDMFPIEFQYLGPGVHIFS